MKTKFDVSEEEKNRILNLVNDMKEKEMINEQLFGWWPGKKCTVQRCQEDGISDALIGSSKKHPKMTIDGERPAVGDRFRMKESRNGNLTGDSDWSDGHSYKVTKIETPSAFGYTYNFPPLSACDPVPVTPSWECINGSCTDPGDGSGQYSSLNDCQTTTNNCTPLPWTCLYEWNSTHPIVITAIANNGPCYQWQAWSTANSSSFQNYATFQACLHNCDEPAPDPSWDCDGQGNCTDPGTGNGQYTSLNDCNNNCVVPAYRCHDCNTPCSQQLIDAGHCPYPTTAQCTAMCVDTNKWRCGQPDKFGTPRCIPCKLFELNNGTNCFNTKQECLASDCGLIRKDPGKTDVSLSNSNVSNVSNVSNTNFTGDGESKELDKRSEIKELALRRIVGKIINSRR